jgi:hypothetical protein
VGVLGALRMLPEVVDHLLQGERPPKPPESMRFRDLPSIPDDGVGGVRVDGSGLVGLRDRLAVLDGHLRIESPAGGGTLVGADIPLEG